MSWRRVPPLPSVRNKYGLPKHVVQSVRHRSIPPEAEAWQRARDDFEGDLRDALDALKAGLISRREYDFLHARLSQARWNAEQQYAHVMRAIKRELSRRRRRR